jgi:putative membrane protein
LNFGTALLNALKGALIGAAEVIPGVSGGTVALVVGLYDRIIGSAASFVRGLIALFRPSQRPVAMKNFRQVELSMLLPLVAGMGIALVAGAALIEPLLHDYPEMMRALFAGMIAASVYVPIKMVGKVSISNLLLLGVGAVAAFVLTSLPRAAEATPSSWWVVLSAALAVCALVLPGVSGSFLLLSMGMYQPTIAAVNDRDFGYLGLFISGAVVGLASFAMLMQFLLSRYHGATLSLMAGLMIGSLRALWPWQQETGEMLPVGDISAALIWFSVGAGVVSALIVWETQLKRRSH